MRASSNDFSRLSFLKAFTSRSLEVGMYALGTWKKGTKGPWELDVDWRGGERGRHTFAAEAVL